MLLGYINLLHRPIGRVNKHRLLRMPMFNNHKVAMSIAVKAVMYIINLYVFRGSQSRLRYLSFSTKDNDPKLLRSSHKEKLQNKLKTRK